MKSSGSKQRATKCLALTSSCEQIVPLMIFKGSRTGRIRREASKYPTGVRALVNSSAWMNAEAMQYWIREIWKQYTQCQESYLLLDEFGVHKRKDVLHSLADCNAEVDFILPGFTSRLQVLDVGINRPFKDYVTRKYDKFMVEKEPRQRVTRLLICKWIDEVWKEVTEDAIFNTWTRTGFIPS